MKRMTTKEFKDAFEKSGYNFEIFGWEGILNMLSSYEDFMAKQEQERGYDKLAQYAKKRADALFDILNERGYYDDAKEA